MPLTRFAPEHYADLLQVKANKMQALFAPFGAPPLEVHSSPPEAYRMRAEFRLWHEGDDLYYAMFDPQHPKTPLRVTEFPIASTTIQAAMPELLRRLKAEPALRRKLFQVEFLSSLSGQLLISLIYRRPLAEDWLEQAQGLAGELGVQLVGRSRKQKIVVDKDYIEEQLELQNQTWHYRHYEQGFTQPNARVNIKMIEWACAVAAESAGDLLELYCGNGNFTLPLCRHFDRVLATEVAKSSMAAARYNQQWNRVENLELVRLSAEEVCQALAGERQFRRLRELHKPLQDFNFSAVFVDPPRAGLDAATERLVCDFDQILYISCNPHTLRTNLEHICQSHTLQRLALFDQFPYTDHVECGAYLRRREESENEPAKPG
ncbi:MAG: tRNA (uridine(54)-C5)-methyltransferase TrmA [Gammaproteobacteria bacterium]|nr:tRNA (uridine(54)-C5)-methyltransferase TrmA [Gammaproteobacteria bacterium]